MTTPESIDAPPGTDGSAMEPAARARMRVQSIRFSEEQWALVQEVAAQQGMSGGQFVRESALAHAFAEAAKLNGDTSVKAWLESLAALRTHGIDALDAIHRHLDELHATGE